MATAKKRAKPARPGIQASEVAVGNRTLEGVLMDLAERSTRAEEISARAEERSARAEEMAVEAQRGTKIALETIGALLQDLRALTQEMRTSNARAEHRLDAIEKAVAAE